MTLPDIALMGYAGSGKDSVAAHLVSKYAYTRVAFADPLKAMALTVDPILMQDYDGNEYRLSEIIQEDGWDRAKRDYPEVRRLLQHLGQAQRDIDEDYWLNLALRKIDAAPAWNLPVVVTDVRYENEYEELRSRGFIMIRVTRPGVGPANDHTSEDADRFTPDMTLHNDSTLDSLAVTLDHLLITLTA